MSIIKTRDREKGSNTITVETLEDEMFVLQHRTVFLVLQRHSVYPLRHYHSVCPLLQHHSVCSCTAASRSVFFYGSITLFAPVLEHHFVYLCTTTSHCVSPSTIYCMFVYRLHSLYVRVFSVMCFGQSGCHDVSFTTF
jgi:hypothetical protein